MKILEQSQKPISGEKLAKEFSVSRQVIVQDIALLRAENHQILSTNKGYLLYRLAPQKEKIQRLVCVRHTKEQIREELYTIVDVGGKALNVIVEHGLYGKISADLNIATRKDVDNFVRKTEQEGSRPLNCLTDVIHYHMIEADCEEILDEVEKELEKKNFLIKR